jgi:hypothetical protein
MQERIHTLGAVIGAVSFDPPFDLFQHNSPPFVGQVIQAQHFGIGNRIQNGLKVCMKVPDLHHAIDLDLAPPQSKAMRLCIKQEEYFSSKDHIVRLFAYLSMNGRSPCINPRLRMF